MSSPIDQHNITWCPCSWTHVFRPRRSSTLRKGVWCRPRGWKSWSSMRKRKSRLTSTRKCKHLVICRLQRTPLEVLMCFFATYLSAIMYITKRCQALTLLIMLIQCLVSMNRPTLICYNLQHIVLLLLIELLSYGTIVIQNDVVYIMIQCTTWLQLNTLLHYFYTTSWEVDWTAKYNFPCSPHTFYCCIWKEYQVITTTW